MGAVGQSGGAVELRRLGHWARTSEGRRFLILLGAALVIRLLIAPVRGFDHDLQDYVSWGASLDHFGIHVYQGNPSVSYPPLTIYFFGFMSGVALVWHAINGLPLDLTVRNSSALIAFMRLPLIATDLVTLCLLYALARRILTARLSLIVVGVYAFLPAVLLDNNLWPQTDNVITLGILLALLLALSGRAGWVGAILAATVLVKPQPIVLVPVALVYLWRWWGWRVAARGVASLAAVGALICAPLLLPPHPDLLYFFADLSSYLRTQPLASPSAFNLWWMLGLQRAHAAAPFVGPLSISLVGDALFVLFLASALLCVWRDRSPATLYCACAVTTLASFDLMSNQHERYMFPCIALFLMAGLYERRYWLLSLVAGLSVFASQALVILWNPVYNRLVLNFSGPHTFFAAHPGFQVGLSVVNVGLLVVALAWMWQGSARPPASAASCGATRLSHGEWAAPTVVQSEEMRAEWPSAVTEGWSSMTEKMLSVVIPCFNERDNIRPMYDRLTAALAEVTSRYELIFVNNGSYDASATVFDELTAHDPRVCVLTLSRNFGSQGAYTAGMEQAVGDCVICIDGDIQDPPELIPAFVKKWQEGYEVVYGTRVRRKGSLIRRIGYKAFYRLFKRLSYIDIPVDAGDFSLMDRRVVDVMNAMPERNRFIRGLRAWAGFRQTGIPYTRQDRQAGETSNSIVDLFRWASMGIVSFSYAPLELISFLAIFVVGLSALALVVYTALYFVVPNAPRGFQTLLVMVLFLGSIQLLCLSIIGTYLGKIFEEIKGRPKYVVQRIQNDQRSRVPDAEPERTSSRVL